MPQHDAPQPDLFPQRAAPREDDVDVFEIEVYEVYYDDVVDDEEEVPLFHIASDARRPMPPSGHERAPTRGDSGRARAAPRPGPAPSGGRGGGRASRSR